MVVGFVGLVFTVVVNELEMTGMHSNISTSVFDKDF